MHGVRRKRQRVALLFLFRSNYQAYQWTGSIFSFYRLREQPTVLTEYDEPLVRRLIEKVTVYENKFTVGFKSGVTVDVDE